MSHVITFNGTVAEDQVISLAPAGSTAIYKACRIRIALGPKTITDTATNGYAARIKPVVAESTPTAVDPDMPAAGLKSGSFLLQTKLSPLGQDTLEIGQPHSKGYNPDANGPVVATHLLVHTVAGNAADECIYTIHVD
jgi:hypothetical protein